MVTDNPRYHSYSYFHERPSNQGPDVQSIVSLTKSLIGVWLSLTELTKSTAVTSFAKNYFFSCKNGSTSMYITLKNLTSR